MCMKANGIRRFITRPAYENCERASASQGRDWNSIGPPVMKLIITQIMLRHDGCWFYFMFSADTRVGHRGDWSPIPQSRSRSKTSAQSRGRLYDCCFNVAEPRNVVYAAVSPRTESENNISTASVRSPASKSVRRERSTAKRFIVVVVCCCDRRVYARTSHRTRATAFARRDVHAVVSSEMRLDY